ncbi:MAG: SAM-dependent methyltransferase [Clostridia bacterium]|nr:SAM-dependent methyltransferase [Clostridia bacterium]
MESELFLSLITKSFTKETLKKLVFSRPRSGEISKIACRLVSHRGRRILAMEFSLPGDTVSHKNIGEDSLSDELMPLIENYSQVNLITVLGDAEMKRSKGGKVTLIGAENLRRKHEGDSPAFEKAIESLDRRKNYILSGDEQFLKKLGISSADGRVHDKKQGKFRQINRFLEHIENVYNKLPHDGEIRIYDLCCGKSYLSFAVYHYLTEIKGRRVYMYGADLKRDVIIWCDSLARELGYTGMHFEVCDILRIAPDQRPDMVISLHACDIATDIVLDTAIRLEAEIILSTPCCHRYLNGKVAAKELSFITDYPHISGKLCEAITDALRLARLKANGYSVSALELTDPENTPKNTLIKAVKNKKMTEKDRQNATAEYEAMLSFVLGDRASEYLKEIKN